MRVFGKNPRFLKFYNSFVKMYKLEQYFITLQKHKKMKKNNL